MQKRENWCLGSLGRSRNFLTLIFVGVTAKVIPEKIVEEIKAKK